MMPTYNWWFFFVWFMPQWFMKVFFFLTFVWLVLVGLGIPLALLKYIRHGSDSDQIVGALERIEAELARRRS